MKISTPKQDNRESIKVFAEKQEQIFTLKNTEEKEYAVNTQDLGRQIRKRKKKKRRYSAAGQRFWQGVLTGFIVFMSIILALVFAWFVFVQPVLNKMLKDINGGSITEFMTLFNEVQTTVTEVDMTDSGKILINNQQVPVYLGVVDKAKQAGLEVFNNTSGIEASLASEDIEFNDVYLTDIELCAVLNSVVNQIAVSLNNDILNYVSTNFRVWQISLYEQNNEVRIKIVVELNLDQLKAKVGTSNLFIPSRTFVVWDAKTIIETDTESDNYGNLAFTDAKVSLNKLSNRSLEILLNLLKSGIPNNNDNLNLSPGIVSSTLASFLEDGVTLVSNTLGANVGVVKNPLTGAYLFKLSD